MQDASEDDAVAAGNPTSRARGRIRLVESLEEHVNKRSLSSEQEAFILDRFSTTLEDPRTGKRIRR